MILCITPDRDVFQYPDALFSDAELQELWERDCVVLRISVLTAGGYAPHPASLRAVKLHVEDWLGADEDTPAIGWTRIEFKTE